MPHPFALIIFDCDGVVVDSEMLSCQILLETLSHYGLTVTLREVFDRFLGRSSSVVETYYRTATGYSLPRDFGAEYRSRLRTAFADALQPMPGIEAILKALRTPFCLASSSDAERIEMTLTAARLGTYFGDRVYSSTMVARGKPAPDLFLHAATAMAVAPAQCLVVEDTVAGVQAAKAAGMTVWGFVGGSHCVERDVGDALRGAGADRIFSAMSELFSPPLTEEIFGGRPYL